MAYLWKGEVHTNTKRRQDSEQAVCAKSWLVERLGEGAALREGWTYVFEAVYRANQVVLSYASDGLVLLAAFDPAGREAVDLKLKQELADEVLAPLVPHCYATREMLAANNSETSTATAKREGWVLETALSEEGGGVRRSKMVSTPGSARLAACPP